MKLNINLNSLFSAVKKMGVSEFVDFSIKPNPPPVKPPEGGLDTVRGIEIPLDDIDIGEVFTYKGKHIVLFIPDHSYNYEEVKMNSRVSGNKYHLTECQAIQKMRRNGRYKRYFATNNRSGIFRIYDKDNQEMDVELSVCKYCLGQLNYQNYNQNRNEVFNRFNLEEFFQYYETQFRTLPDNINTGGYVNNWEQISKTYRQSVNWRCEECGVDLTQNKHLLDVHHKDGVKSHNEKINFKAVCKICHSKQPLHEHMRVEFQDEMLIRKLRSEQGIF